MIIVYVKHYLNRPGLKYFDDIWYPKVCKIIEKQPGFVAIESHKDTLDPRCVHITVRFMDSDSLEAWGKTHEHSQVINLLDPYRTKSWEVSRTDNESQNSDNSDMEQNKASFLYHLP